MPAPSRLRAQPSGQSAAPPATPAPPPALAMAAAPPPPPAAPSPRRPGLRWRLEAASRLLIEDVWSAWAIAGWLRERWPEASPAAAVARWLEETR